MDKIIYVSIYCKVCKKGLKMKVVNWVAICPECGNEAYRKKGH